MSPRSLGPLPERVTSRTVRGILLRERRLAIAQGRLDRWLAKAEPARCRVLRLRSEIGVLEVRLTGSQRGQLERIRRVWRSAP